MLLMDGELVFSPTDLVGYLACEHKAHLDLLLARGALQPAESTDRFAQLVREQGAAHEERHLAVLESAGLRVARIPRVTGGLTELSEAASTTEASMRAGVDVIYQGTFFERASSDPWRSERRQSGTRLTHTHGAPRAPYGRWRGHADFLRRVETPSSLGSWSYEVHDTKLAGHATPGAVLQVAEYSRQLSAVQAHDPQWMHLVLGDGIQQDFAYADVRSYLETVRERFMADAAAGLTWTSPDPVQHCAVCEWAPRCTQEWRPDDHLSLVASIRRDQRIKLTAAGVQTRRALAVVADAVAIPGLHAATLGGLRDQARLQVLSEDSCSVAFELLPVDEDQPHRGLPSLPRPSDGDIFFDMESDPFASEGGREYLFGWVDGDHPGATFHALWAHDQVAERRAFETFIDTVMERRRRHADMHVYHYAPYETSAMKRLVSRHHTRDDDVDQLLRSRVFVDLYRVVRQSVRVGVESYSLKALEPLYASGTRSGDIRDAAASVVDYERWRELTASRLDTPDGTAADRILAEICRYNEEDCRSLVGLRAWLERRRAELERTTGRLPRPTVIGGAAPSKVEQVTHETQPVVAALIADVPEDPASASAEQRARQLLANLLEWHRRDSRPQWWEHYARLGATDQELVDDDSSLGSVSYEGVVGRHAKSRLHRFSFPPQDTKLELGDQVFDPRGRQNDDGSWGTRRVGRIHELDLDDRFVIVKSQKWEEPIPSSLVPGQPVDTTAQQKALLRLGRWVSEHGIDAAGPHRAARDLLMRHPPRVVGVVAGDPLPRAGESPPATVRRLVRDAADGCIPVQGPPGTGKTRTAAAAIVDLATSGRRVGITALSHRAIGELLRAVSEEMDRRGVTLTVLQKAEGGSACTAAHVQCVGDNQPIDSALSAGQVDVIAGTSFLFAREPLEATLDSLFVDEASQLSLANVVAMAGCARNLVLVGDPQQLEQPSSAVHPEGAGASALGHLLGGETISSDRGVFLETSHRMHPEICSYISDTFYGSRLRSQPECAQLRLLGPGDLEGAGLRWLPVEHDGNRSASAEEAAAVASLVERLLGQRWTRRDGAVAPLTPEDVLVVAPYNAQVARLRQRLPHDVRVRTVDRAQGQESAVVIYSMATSVAEDVPRGMEFLFSTHRLNVAISRAQCLAVLVCSPQLLQVRCRNPEQLALANALCSFVQRASQMRLDQSPLPPDPSIGSGSVSSAGRVALDGEERTGTWQH